jgi:hypothetical protein
MNIEESPFKISAEVPDWSQNESVLFCGSRPGRYWPTLGLPTPCGIAKPFAYSGEKWAVLRH